MLSVCIAVVLGWRVDDVDIERAAIEHLFGARPVDAEFAAVEPD